MDERKKMYFELHEKCKEICETIDNNLLNAFDELDKSLRTTITIENQLIENDNFYDLEEQMKNIYNEIKANEPIIIAKYEN